MCENYFVIYRFLLCVCQQSYQRVAQSTLNKPHELGSQIFTLSRLLQTQ